MLPAPIRRFRSRVEHRRARRKLQQELDRTYSLFEGDLEQATEQTERERIENMRAFDCSEYEDQIQRLDSLALIERGKRCHVDVADFPAPPDIPLHWMRGPHGTYYLNPKSFREFARAVELAEYERKKRNIELRDSWLKIWTGIVATIGAITGIMALFKHR
jgi:hypothetical protein